MAKKTLNFSNIERFSYKAKSGKEKGGKGKFIKFGNDNSYPNYLINLYNHSSIHASCVNSVVEAIRGEGLVTENESTLQYANKAGESWTDIYNKVAYDYKLFGGFGLEIIWSRDRTRIAEVYHIDFSYLRAKERDYRNVCPGYFINNDWSKYSYGQVDLDSVPYLPVYNPLKKEEEPKQILVHKPYRPGQEYYPLPDYVGATAVIDLDKEVDNFHINNLKNGLTPSVAITTFTNASDDERYAIEQMLKAQYAGTGNAGNMLYMDVDDPASAPQITTIPQNGSDGYYVAVNDMVSQKILTAHRITSPALLGIKENTGLGNNADELVTAWRLFLNTVILPYQQSILSVFENLLQVNYPGITVGVIQDNPLVINEQEDNEVVTSQEAEVEEINDLEEQVEIINE